MLITKILKPEQFTAQLLAELYLQEFLADPRRNSIDVMQALLDEMVQRGILK